MTAAVRASPDRKKPVRLQTLAGKLPSNLHPQQVDAVLADQVGASPELSG
jgi:hypothetical protein